MQFALNAACFPHDSIAENVALAAEAGYQGIEPRLRPDGALTDPDARREIAALADEHGLAIPSVLSPAFWQHPMTSVDRETRERGVEMGERLVAAADELGAETVLVVPGQVNEETPYDAAYENALESVRELNDAAAEHGVTLAIENVWNDFLLSPREFATFVDDAGESVGAYFDVGNVRRFGRPEQWIRILGDRIAAVHVKDYDTDVDTANGFTYPLQGDVPWDAVNEALAEIGYDGWIAPEVSPYETRGERMPAQVLDNLRAVF